MRQQYEHRRIVTPFGAQSTVAEVFKGIDLRGKRAIDFATPRHPPDAARHTLQRPAPTVDHGAPLRLPVPVKLGLENVKAITTITYVAEEPRDYWAERGYSRYDGI